MRVTFPPTSTAPLAGISADNSARHQTHSGLLLAAVAAGPEAVPDPFGYLTHIALFARAALRTWPT
jgi:hypothetical protein